MNDLRLNELLIDIGNELRLLDDMKRHNKLGEAYIIAKTMREQIDLVMYRLNDLTWPKK